MVIYGGGNWRTRVKPPSLDGQPLPCHVPTLGFDPGSHQWQASALTTALSMPLLNDLLVSASYVVEHRIASPTGSSLVEYV